MIRSSQAGSTPLVVALFLSAAFHVLYFFWAAPRVPLSPAPFSPPPESGIQLISLSGSGQENPALNSLKLYSPAIFAFPTPVGFSASLLNQRLRTPPPRVSRTLTDSGLSLQSRTRFAPEISFSPAPPTSPQAAAPELIIPHGSPGPFNVAVHGPDSFMNRAPMDWPTPTKLPEQFWTGTITVTLAPNGHVRQALVTRQHEPVDNPESWARWAYGIRFEPGAEAETGHLQVQWVPPGQTEAETP